MKGIELEYGFYGEWLLYFFLSFLVPFLMIQTCCSCSEDEEEDEKDKPSPHPEYILHNVTDHNRRMPLLVKKSKQKRRRVILKKIGLIVIWIVLFVVVCRMSPIFNESEEFDPFLILDVDEETSISEIKRAYHELSKQHHPDRGGDPERFKEIAKAYAILTDEKAKSNWIKYGNPDGLKELHVGFAVPKWLVDPKNSMFVLCVYTALFLGIALGFCCCCCSRNRIFPSYNISIPLTTYTNET